MQYMLKNCQAMRQWLQQPTGKIFLASEHHQIAEILPRLFGYHLLILGEPAFASCTSTSTINHQILINPCLDIETSNVVTLVTSRQDKLPIESNSIDAVYLAHCLELTNNPHEVLRETYRVLRPEGIAIITGFNPWRLWGLWQLLVKFYKNPPWYNQLISTFQLENWLSILEFDILHAKNFCFSWPTNHRTILQKIHNIEQLACNLHLSFGVAYIIMACKRMSTLTPIKQKWQFRRRIMQNNVAESLVEI